MKILLGLMGLVLQLSTAWAFEITSHKTAGHEYPENTLEGFVYSLGLPVQSIEFDLHLTRDKVLVLSHDPVLDEVNCFAPGSGRRLIIAHTDWQEIAAQSCRNATLNQPYRVPRFDAVVDAWIKSGRQDLALNVEIKVLDKLIENWDRYDGLDRSQFHAPHQALAEQVYAVLRARGIKGNIVFSSFSRALLLEFKAKKNPDEQFRFALLFKGEYSPILLWLPAKLLGRECYDTCWYPDWAEARQWVEGNGIDAFMPNWPQLDHAFYRHGYKKTFVGEPRSFKIQPWPVNGEADWRKMRQEYDFDGVITDLPGAFLGIQSAR